MAFFSRNNLRRIKDGAYIINIDDKSQETNWVSLFMDRNTADSFGTEYIPEEVLNQIREKSVSHNIFRIQNEDSNMCGFYCFHGIYFCRKNFVRLCYKIIQNFLFSVKRMTRTNMSSIEFKLKTLIKQEIVF